MTKAIYMSSFTLKLVISREMWNDLMTNDNVVVLQSVINTARETINNAGDFIIEGNPDVGQDTSMFDSRAKFDEFLAELNQLRDASGKSKLR